jgi:hypothetical protein
MNQKKQDSRVKQVVLLWYSIRHKKTFILFESTKGSKELHTCNDLIKHSDHGQNIIQR